MWSKCFPSIRLIDPKGRLPECPEVASYSCAYTIPGQESRLHVSIEPDGRVTPVGMEAVIKLVLTARGKPLAANLAAAIDWFDLGHDWVKVLFNGLVSDEMHQHWGYKK